MKQELISNAQKKLAAQLDMAKYRRRFGMFKAEGTKCVVDTIDYFDCTFLAATADWVERHEAKLPAGIPVFVAKPADMVKMTHLTTAPEVIAVFQIPDDDFDIDNLSGRLVIALDGVQDPGNLGTIMRLADWFGVERIICSKDTVDLYNPKAVMASMGAISRVRVAYCNLPEVISRLNGTMDVFGTFLDGDNIYEMTLPDAGIIVFGNEGNGVTPEVGNLVSSRLTIPSYPPGRATSESLNVAMAAAVVLSQFRASK